MIFQRKIIPDLYDAPNLLRGFIFPVELTECLNVAPLQPSSTVSKLF
jgi:hypothetical protein